MKYFLSIVIFSTLISCDWRTPSRERFSDYCDIEIPENVEVMKDEYYDHIQDYSITYEIKLSKKECNILIKNIKNSIYFNPDVKVNEEIKPYMYKSKSANDNKAIWYRTKKGFQFQNDESRTDLYAEVDTVRLIAKFEEWYD